MRPVPLHPRQLCFVDNTWSTRAPGYSAKPKKAKVPVDRGGQDFENALRAEGIEMWFGNVGALTGVDLSVGRNEIVGLIGDNGAGKSTLIKIITGVLRPSAGSLYIRDREVGLQDYSVFRAHQYGIETVHQERSLCEKQPLWRNFFVGRQITNRLGFIDVRKQKELAQEILLKSIGFPRCRYHGRHHRRRPFGRGEAGHRHRPRHALQRRPHSARRADGSAWW